MRPETETAKVAVTSIGMVTPAGVGAYTTCATLRAGLSMMQELEYFLVEKYPFEEHPVLGCRVSGLTEGMTGVGLWTRMGAYALRDLMGNDKYTPSDLSKTHLYLGLPQALRPGMDQRLPSMLVRRLGEWLDTEGLEERTVLFQDGHASALKAAVEAAAAIAQGEIVRAVVGGIDSHIETETLEYFLEGKRLKTEDHPDGCIPGEGAAFFALEAFEAARKRGAEVLAVIDGGFLATEPETVWSERPSAAIGLSRAFDETLDRLAERGADTGLIVGDLNGESYRAREFALAVTRALRHLRQPWRLWHAADCIGDTGAASGAISLCMAARAFQRGYARTHRALVFGASDEGLRAVLSLTAAA